MMTICIYSMASSEDQSPNCISDDENEDLDLSCSICFEPYDDSDRLPKFLTCHHSCCVHCLQVKLPNNIDRNFIKPFFFIFIRD